MQFGQRLQFVTSRIKYFIPEGKGMVDMWDRNDVPGTAGQRTLFESVEVVGEVEDDHFHRFEWQATSGLMRSARLRRCVPEQAADPGLASIPGYHGHAIREAEPCGADSTEVRAISPYE